MLMRVRSTVKERGGAEEGAMEEAVEGAVEGAVEERVGECKASGRCGAMRIARVRTRAVAEGRACGGVRASRCSALLVSQRLLTPEEVLQTVHQTHGRSVGASYGVRGGGRSVQAVGGGDRHRVEAVRRPDEREQQVREGGRHLSRRHSTVRLRGRRY